MLRNYLKITFRSLLKNKWYTSINILGLTLGIATALVIALIIRYELSFDQHHAKKENIYRIVRNSTNSSGLSSKPNIPYPMADALRSQLPNMSDGIAGIHYHDEEQIEVDQKKILISKIVFAEPQLFNILDISVLSGNPMLDLAQPNKAFISQRLAQQLFGEDSAVGKHLKLAGEIDLEIAGVLANPIHNSHLEIDLMVSYLSFNDSFTGGFPIDQWGVNMSGYTYVLLPSPTDKNAVESALSALTKTHYNDDDGETTTFHLQPISDIHFNQDYSNDTFKAIDENYIFTLSCIGIFVLTIACVNFVNMSTAQASQRAKEVGMRKTLGANRVELMIQFLSESFAITLSALVLAIGVTERIIPAVNHFLGKSLTLDLVNDPFLLLLILCLLIFVTVAAGLYPSLVLANYQPVNALKVKFNTTKRSGISLRTSLVAFQFVISQVLIIATIVISAQTDYFFNKPLGFDKDMIITIDLPERDSLKNQTLKQTILQNSAINSVSFAVGAPTSENNLNTSFIIDEHADDQQYDIALKTADKDYQKTYGLELISGRWFNDNDISSKEAGLYVKNALVVNETTVKMMGYDIDEVLGKNITIGLNNISAPIVGVVKDFHLRSFHREISPMVILEAPQLYYQTGIKLSSNDLQETISFLKSSWENVYPEYIFQYNFLDEDIASNYEAEERTFTLFKIFAGISIFICCIGLFGLISFVVSKKTKEVGIRKALGASVSSILFLFTNEFLKIILVAFVIATPVVWFFLNNWLNGFAYHIDIHAGFFIMGLVFTALITITSIGYQSIKAALVNPVNSLKDE